MKNLYKFSIMKAKKKYKSKLAIKLHAIRYFLWTGFVNFFADVQVTIKPMFFIFGTLNSKIKGEQTREMMNLLQPGDMLLGRFDHYLGSVLVPGYYSHIALFAGEIDNKPDIVYHALGHGVTEEDFLNFVRRDKVLIMRPKELTPEEIKFAIEKAKKAVGTPYDYDFNFSDDSRFSCSEFLFFVYNEVKEKLNMKLDKNGRILPDHFLKINGEIIYET